LIVFADEHADTIDDGWLFIDTVNRNTWNNVPANYHNRRGDFNFADGHAELHKWTSYKTWVRVTEQDFPPTLVDSVARADVDWICSHVSAPMPKH